MLGTFALVAGIYTWLSSGTRSKLRLPPGPPQLPIVGNLFSMTARPWEACMQWSRRYNSDIIHLNLAGTSVIVLSSFAATEALLEKRASIYSDRPAFPMAGDLMGWDFLLGEPFSTISDSRTLTFESTHEIRRIHRRLFTEGLNDISEFRAVLRNSVHSLLGRVMVEPQDYLNHLHQMAGEMMMSVAYGMEPKATNSHLIALAEEATKAFSDVMIPGQYLVDFIPILRHLPNWFPGAGFKRIAQGGKLLASAVRDIPFNETKEKIESGTARPCFTVNALHELEQGKNYYQELTVKNVAAMMYLAGADIIVSTLSTFMLAMLVNPDAQKKAQQELDSVLGVGNLPNFCDEEALPYTAAVVKEVLRWKNAEGVGVPHRLTVDDEYEGYHLPAGSIVFGNVWAILHDEVEYPEPLEFLPERFLLNGKHNPAVRDPHECAFGFGRRICPGRGLGHSSIWITIASLLATIDIKKEIGSDGCPIEPSYEFSGGIVFSPLPFKCAITPRSPQAAASVQAT
ncbi:cytochrome P450 [Favolaschia claudopus]|uniref:Cytochrome P450 n=1 Tax=Favolaschia claudopus TaxID=2862362 RepID=A0AAV9ZQP4_9AGAR